MNERETPELETPVRIISTTREDINKFIGLQTDTLGNDKPYYSYYSIYRTNAKSIIAILLLTSDYKFIIIEQYRVPIRRYSTELIA